MQKYFDSITGANGVAATGAAVTVLNYGTTTPASIFSDASGLIAKTNPIAADATGYFDFYAADGRYSLSVSAVGFATKTLTDIQLEDIKDGLAVYSASSGSSLVGHTQSGTGAVVTTVQAKLRESVSVMDFGAVGDGVTDDTAAIQAALNSAATLKQPVNLLGGRFKVSSRLNVGSYSGIVGNGNAVLFATAAGFSNTSNSNHYAATSAVVDMSGQLSSPFTSSKNVIASGFCIEFESGDGRSVDGITCRNADSPRITNVEIKNGCVGAGIRASSIVGAGLIANNYIHDFYTNAVWATHPQTTGIEMDGDRINSVASSGVRITDNVIKNIALGATTMATWGLQTDGINLQEGSRYLVSGNAITECNEAIDFFCSDSDIDGNFIENAKGIGIKIIHGAQRNKVRNNSVINAGWSGIILAASDNRGQSVDSNIIENNSIVGVDYLSYWGPLGYNTACISTWTSLDPVVTYQPTKNIIRNNFCNPKSTGKYGLFRGSQGSNNVFEGNVVVTGASVADTGTLGFETGITGFVGAATAATGSGSLVLATSPTLVTPALGTPSSVTLTNATGLPVSSGISGLATGAATFLATPSSANLAALLTDETGSGANVFATSPTLTTPNVTGLQTVTNTSAGAAAVALSLTNSSASANTETVLDFSPSSAGVGVRSAQISAVNNGSNNISFKFSLSNAASPVGVGFVNSSGSWFFGAGGSPVINSRLINGGSQFSNPSVSEYFSASASSNEHTFTKSRNATQGSHAIVVDGDVLGKTEYFGSDGSTYRAGANFRARVTGTPSASSMPTRFEISTTPVGSVASTVRVTVNPDGDIWATAGATTMAAGFFRIPSASGVPTGVPAAVSGTVPMYFDSTNNHFYIYSTTWKKVLLA